MGQRTQAAAGCLTAALGADAGLAVWTVDVRARLWRFEHAPDAELPLTLLGGTAVALAL